MRPDPDLPTPYLALDIGAVGRAYRNFRRILPQARVHYAMKCNPDPAILRCLHTLGGSFEIASGVELADLRTVGVDPGDVLFSNPVKMWQHIRTGYAAGVWRFAFDSVAELEKLATYAPGVAVYVRLRTSPAGSQVPSEGKFGVDAEAARRLMRDAVTMGLQPYGVAFHVGSQMIDPTAWVSAIADSGKLMTALDDDGIRIEMLDLGGGFPGAYASYTPDLTEYADQINAALRRHLPYPVDLVIEPGRALVAEAGTMVATVIGVAERRGQHWVHLDVGAFNGLMEALESGNTLRFPITDSRNDADRRLCHVTGPTCDSQDTILYDVPLSAGITTGDTVYIHSAGAYTTSYASRFNGFELPPIHLRSALDEGAPGPP